MSIRIRIEHGQDAGKTMRLGRAGVYVLGRHPSASMRVLDMKVSKAHCEVHVGDNGTSAMLRDLGSTHGCQVNGQPISEDTGLNPGDEVRLGLTILRVLSDGDADQELEPTQGRDLDEASVGSSATQERTQGLDTSSVQKLPPDELVGKDLGGYTVEQKIGKGGMGSVYLAEQVSLKRKVALKVLSEKFVKDSAFVDQFLNEARSAGAMNHPNVVQVYDVGSADGHYFFSMEFVSGGSIEEILKKQPAKWKEALNWFLDATNALVFAKKRGILHRDVKPDNLMVSEDGSAKLCDLGLAKRSENEDLMSQGIIGTPHFISPEAVRRKTAIDHRTDLYSLGCTFYRILAGKNPYPGKTVKEILLGHLNKPVPHITEHVKDVPRELDAIVHKLMAKDPEERYQSPDELLAALDKVRLQHGLEEHGIKPKSRKPIIIAAAVLLAVAAGTIIWLVNQDKGTGETVFVTTDTKAIDEKERVAELALQVRGIPTQALSELTALNGRRQEDDIKETWKTKTATWEALAADYDTKAGEWRAKVEEWATAKAAEQAKHEPWTTAEKTEPNDALLAEFEDLFKTFDTATSELSGFAKRASDAAEKIRDYVKTRGELETQVATGHDEAVAAVEKKLIELVAELDRKLAAGEWLDLEENLTREKIDELLQPIIDGAVLEHPLIGKIELLRPAIPPAKPGGKHTPSEVDDLIKKHLGEPLGEKKWIDPALKALRAEFKEAWTKANKALKDNAKAPKDPGVGPIRNPKPKNTHKSYEEAIKILEAFRDALPSNRGGKGKIAKQINEWRDALNNQIGLHQTADKELGYADLRHDKQAYFELLVELRHPPTNYDDINIGMFHLLDATVLPSIKMKADQAAADMRTERYREITEIWSRDATALAALLQHLKSSLEDGWSRKIVELDGKNDKVEKKKPKSISESGIQFGREDETRFRELGPKTLIERVFYYQGEPRFEFTRDDVRGLGILGELAGDRAAAEKHYIQYKTLLKAPADAIEIADVSFRLNGLVAEMQAAAAWNEANAVKLELYKFIRTCDPKFIGLRNFDDAIREKILVEMPRFITRLNEANNFVDDLTSKKEWAGTAWGSALRRDDGPHRDVAYAGETLPPKKAAPNRKPNPPAPAGAPAPGPVNPGPVKPNDPNKPK